jgi:hypothetical protein
MAKQPDCSYVPVNLTAPPAHGNPITITPENPLGDPFPTMVFECAYTNEDWARLMNDARTKTFAATTSIQLWIGCKIYKSDRSFRCVWGKRRARGHNMRIMRTSVSNPVQSYLLGMRCASAHSGQLATPAQCHSKGSSPTIPLK